MTNPELRRIAGALVKALEQQPTEEHGRPCTRELASGLAALDALSSHLAAGGDFPMTPFQRDALSISRNSLKRYLDRERRAGR